MGLDQTLAPKIVDCDGKIVEADAKMLRINRGGGGMLGVIVELTSNIFPLEKVILQADNGATGADLLL